MKKNNRHLFVILIVVCFFLSLRMIHPAADPPDNLSMSGGPFGDPGGYAFHARNKILFGQWEIDKMNSPLYSSPIPALMTYLSFKLFGIGFIQMNLVPVLFSCLTLIFVFLLLRDTLNGSPSLTLIAFSLLGLNYLFLMYSRIANRVMPMVFFLVLSLFFFQKGTKNKNWYFLAGASSFLAFATKGVCFYIIGAFFLGFFAYLTFEHGWKKASGPFAFYLAGFCLFFLLWMIVITIPHKDDLRSISSLNVSFLIPPKSLQRILYYFWIRPSLLFERSPVLSLLSGFSVLLFLSRAAREAKKIKLLEWVILFWFILSVIYFSIIQQRVTRHFIPQLIPMVFLSAWSIQSFLRSDRLTKPPRFPKFFGMLLFFWLLFPLSKILKPVLDRMSSAFSNIWVATGLLASVSILVVVLVFFLIRLWPDSLSLSFSPLIKKITILLILLGVIFFNGKPYLDWALHPKFKLRDISLDLGKAFDHAVISGLWAPVISLENKHRAHESFPGFVNDEKDFLEKFQITHVFASTAFNNQEIDYYRRNFPQAMRKARLLAKYPVWRTEMLLYELKPSEGPSGKANNYEAEIHTRHQGMPRFDPEASGRFAVLSEKGNPGFVSVVPLPEKISEGRYRVTFRMKRPAESVKSHARIARIDVVSPDSRRLLVAKNLSQEDLPDTGIYQEFVLSIELKRPDKLNIRVYADGQSAFWVDCMWVEKIPGV
jgi:4-amino-4-deoxy-L-arabinose transferase-like glycosyltransferase